MTPNYLRKRLWINAAFQSRLLLRMVVYLMVFVVVMWHTSFVFELLPGLIDGNNLNRGIGGMYLDSLARQKPFLVALFLTLPAALYDLLKYSHRVAGPLFRCQKVMQAMAAGQVVQEFKPRDGDHMPEFFQAFNDLIIQWNARLAADANGQPGVSDLPALDDGLNSQTQNRAAGEKLKASA
jgi:hypothetical protein